MVLIATEVLGGELDVVDLPRRVHAAEPGRVQRDDRVDILRRVSVAHEPLLISEFLIR